MVLGGGLVGARQIDPFGGSHQYTQNDISIYQYFKYREGRLMTKEREGSMRAIVYYIEHIELHLELPEEPSWGYITQYVAVRGDIYLSIFPCYRYSGKGIWVERLSISLDLLPGVPRFLEIPSVSLVGVI